METDRRGLEVLSRAECLRLLGRAGVGRVVVSDRVLPAAFPVNFALLDGDVVFLTAAGSKLEAATDEQVVAFQVDQIDPASRSGWSVLVQGRAGVVDAADDVARARALPLAPWAPVGPGQVVRIRSEIVTGRRVMPSRPEPAPLHPACPSCGSTASGSPDMVLSTSGAGR